MKLIAAKTKIATLLAIVFLGACEPLTEAEIAAHQQRQAELKAEQEKIAAAQETSCRSDLTQFICRGVQERLIQICQEQAKARHEYVRKNGWGDTVII